MEVVAMAPSSSQALAPPSSQHVDSASTEPVDSASTQPEDSASTQPGDSASPLPVDSASSKHMDATIVKIEDPPNVRTGQLSQAIAQGDLEKVRLACESNPSALKESITENSDTILHVALAVGAVARHIVDFILSRMLDYIPDFSNTEGNTVLSVAAIVGNVQAAIEISKRLPRLNTVANKSGYIPVMEAARYGQKEMIKKLLPFNEGIFQSEEDARGFDLVNLLIVAGFYDLAHELVERYRHLATMTPHGEEKSLLSSMARKPSAFLSGRKLDYWQRCFLSFSSCTEKIHEKILMYHKALELVQLLCKEVRNNLDDQKASSILRLPLLLTATLGVHEVVEEIIQSFPPAIWFSDEENHNAFQLAVINHQEKVINAINRMSAHRYVLLESIDNDGNNILHLAGRQAPENQLDRIPGAALRMQRDLKWFKKMETVVPTTCKESMNSEGKTPAMVFSENHKDLVKNGENWMKKIATSGIVAATFIATLVFAAAVSVPGGNNDDSGEPNLKYRISFVVFGVFDAISLLSAIAAMIMFLSLFTARYSENDFLHVLPRRLILGLSLLFVSVITMTVAYGLIIYLVFCKQGKRWMLFAVGTSTFVPLSLFAYSQLPLLHDLIISTYNFSELRICTCSKCYNANASSSE